MTGRRSRDKQRTMDAFLSRKLVDELTADLTETKAKLERITHSAVRFDLPSQQVLELTYICQRIEYYLKVYGRGRES